jgi:uncharacterized protein
VKIEKILLMSDTHLGPNQTLPPALLPHIEACDRIIHAGDLVSVELMNRLSALKPLTAAQGNMDCHELKLILPEIASLEVMGTKIGVIHGWGAPSGIVNRVLPKVQDMGFDVVIYGHSHFPDICGVGGILFVNPGSAVDRRAAPYCSVGVLEIGEDGAEDARIIQLD